MVHAVSDENDFKAQLESAGNKLVIVDFHATWCGPCKMIAPYYKELSEEFKEVVFLKVDIDDNEEIAAQYEVTGIPKFVLIKQKDKVAEMLGTDKNKLKNLVVNHK